MHNKGKRQVSKSTIEYCVLIIFTYEDNFWVLQSDGIHPQILSNKYIIFSRNEEEKWC